MEIVKKFGLWAAAALLVIAAIAVYFVFVSPIAGAVAKQRAELEGRRNELKTWADKARADQVPNPAKIETARKNADLRSASVDQCELLLARQPRWAYTIHFFIPGTEVEIPLDKPNDKPYDWLKLYREYNNELRNQIKAANIPFTLWVRDWGTSLPPREEIDAAQEMYWYQKDLIDFLTGQVEKDFAAYIKDRGESFPATPYDLVVNRKPGRLDEILRATGREKLVAVLGAILVNRQQQDLATIFDALLPDRLRPDGKIEVPGCPWKRPASDRENPSVLGLTMDDQQEKFLAEMLPEGKPDLTDHRRFYDYAMELRTVRYRADVVGLLETHDFGTLASSLRRGTEQEFESILKAIADPNGDYNTTRIAEAISAIVSIRDQKDFLLVQHNHAPNIAEVNDLKVSTPGESAAGGPGRAGPGASAPSDNGLFKRRTFELSVRLDFERIPVFVRRLISNGWRYNVTFLSVEPILKTAGLRTAPAHRTGAPGLPHETGLPPPMPGPGPMPFNGNPAPPSSAGQPEAPLEVGNFVILRLNGEAFQFTPLMTKYKSKLQNENRAQPPAVPQPGRTAPPTGAR